MITLGEYEQREKRLGPARASAGDNTYARQRGTAYVSNSVSEEVHEDESSDKIREFRQSETQNRALKLSVTLSFKSH